MCTASTELSDCSSAEAAHEMIATQSSTPRNVGSDRGRSTARSSTCGCRAAAVQAVCCADHADIDANSFSCVFLFEIWDTEEWTVACKARSWLIVRARPR